MTIRAMLTTLISAPTCTFYGLATVPRCGTIYYQPGRNNTAHPHYLLTPVVTRFRLRAFQNHARLGRRENSYLPPPLHPHFHRATAFLYLHSVPMKARYPHCAPI